MNTPATPLKLSDQRRRLFDRVLGSPAVAELVAVEESKDIETRKALIAELVALPTGARKSQAAAEARCKAANARLQQAESEVIVARREVLAAQAAASAADPEPRAFAIRVELKKTADPRLADALFELNVVEQTHLPAMYAYSFAPGGRDVLGRRLPTQQFSNVAEIAVARQAIGEARAHIESVQLTAMSSTQVTDALKAIVEQLRAPLSVVGLKPFGLDERDGCSVTPSSDRELVAETLKHSEAA